EGSSKNARKFECRISARAILTASTMLNLPISNSSDNRSSLSTMKRSSAVSASSFSVRPTVAALVDLIAPPVFTRVPIDHLEETCAGCPTCPALRGEARAFGPSKKPGHSQAFLYLITSPPHPHDANTCPADV